MHSWWKSPWWAAAAVVVPAGLMLYGVSVPGGNYDTLVAALWGWAIVGLAWLVTSVAWLGDSPPESRWRLWPLVVVPAVFTASWWASSGDLVGKATFAHYRADLERLADRAPVHEVTAVGPYSFNSVGRVSGCVLYNLRGPGMAQASGFAWCPGTTPTEAHWSEGEVFEPIDGDWYVFLVRHGAYTNRATGADPWGLQITELRSIPHV
ncbi:hypothetical protein AB0M46_05120 [Dactylosporangium sp. NPDC051485]|uniref:hypothetical protein n=1 Tax=Dactylosporangium sp. NPDC051485 TaxID=3154846 RepID=UPI00341D46AB